MKFQELIRTIQYFFCLKFVDKFLRNTSIYGITMVDSMMSQLPQLMTTLCFTAGMKFSSKSKFMRTLGPARY